MSNPNLPNQSQSSKNSGFIGSFRLEVRKKGQLPLNIEIQSSISVGSDPRNDIVLVNKNALPQHLLFELKGENLSLTNFAKNSQTYLNSVPLESNKNYLLDIRDHIQISELEIWISESLDYNVEQVNAIGSEENSRFSQAIEEESPPPLPPEENFVSEVPAQHESPPDFVEKSNVSIKKNQKHILEHFKLWVVRFYALIADFFLTYFIVTFIIVQFDRYDLYYQFLNGAIRVIESISPYSIHPMFISFYFLRIFQLLIFGNTIGQILCGLRFNSQKSALRMIGRRILIIVLGLILIPAHNNVSDHFFFKSMRKIGLFIFFSFTLFAPIFIKHEQVTKIVGEQKIRAQEIQTQSHLTFSDQWKMALKLEIPKKYVLFPFAQIKKGETSLGFELVNLKDKSRLNILESNSIDYHAIEERLNFYDPFYRSFFSKKLSSLSITEKKNLIFKFLTLSHEESIESLLESGPFFGSQILIKKLLLSHFQAKDEIIVKNYSNANSTIFIESNHWLKVLLFTEDKIVSFTINKTKDNVALVDFASEQILNRWISKVREKENQTLDILEIFEALKREDEQTALTYYILAAKKLQESKVVYEEVDYTMLARELLALNIESISTVMKNRNSKTSLEDIKHQLIPMENPGEKNE